VSNSALVGVFTDNYTFTKKFLLVKTRIKGIMHRFFENPKQVLYMNFLLQESVNWAIIYIERII